MEEIQKNNRVRINLSQTAKGHVQFDCTTEFNTVEECGRVMRLAIDEARSIIKEKGLIEAGGING